jgi:Mrp family chromosome partitioning ATPase
MEGIIKALRVATQERAAPVPHCSVADMPAAAEARQAPEARPAPEPATVAYTSTRVIDVPKARLESARIVTGARQDSATRAYKLLRTQVMQRLASEGWRTIAVVSPTGREGKTLTAINLGIALAAASKTTALLVDVDWRRPSVHARFGITPDHDIRSYLDGEQSLCSVIVNPGLPRFCFIPCRAPLADASERLAGTGVRALVEELRGRYADRIVLFDLPPMLVTDDALCFLPHVESVLVVVEEDRTRRGDLEKTLELIGPNRLLGTVLNKSSSTLPGY